MTVFAKKYGFFLATALLLGLFAVPVRAQKQGGQHIVSLDEMSADAARPAANRAANESAIRQLFSSEQAQKALHSANIDYKKVDTAVSQLSDEDLAKIAERSRQAQNDFAAGHISRDGWLIILVAVAALIIVLAIVF